MTFSDLFYLFPVCLVALVFMALFWLITGYLAFYSVDRQLRRCPSCKRSAVGTIIDTQLEPLQVRIDHSKLTPVRYKREKVTDTYHCARCGHTWTRSFERRQHLPVKGTPPGQ